MQSFQAAPEKINHMQAAIDVAIHERCEQLDKLRKSLEKELAQVEKRDEKLGDDLEEATHACLEVLLDSREMTYVGLDDALRGAG